MCQAFHLVVVHHACGLAEVVSYGLVDDAAGVDK